MIVQFNTKVLLKPEVLKIFRLNPKGIYCILTYVDTYGQISDVSALDLFIFPENHRRKFARSTLIVASFQFDEFVANCLRQFIVYYNKPRIFE